VINKNNWRLVKAYLEYRSSVDQIAEGSFRFEQTQMRFILEWAGERSFQKAPAIRPTLPEYMLSARLDGKGGRLSAGYVKRVLATARRFFLWLSNNNPGFKVIKASWINTLKVKRLSDIPKTTEAISLDEVLAIAKAPVSSTVERRIRAGAVMLFLSGMRIGAFVSLPIKAVDLKNRTIYQYPSYGVRTKNGKYGVTTLLDIAELLEVVQAWDQEVRTLLPEDGFWFAPLSPETGEIEPGITEIGRYRVCLARKNLRAWLAKVGLPYHSPHKFRHGHVHYGLAHAQTIEDYKAVSLNVMHSSMEITDQFYSVLNDDQVHQRISAMGKNSALKDADQEKLFADFQAFLAWRKYQSS
jgi:integrase